MKITILILALLICGFAPSDFDNDGDVDGLDLALIANEFGSVTCSASFSWSPNQEYNLYGYRVHYGLQSRQYDKYVEVSKEETTVTITGLDCDLIYYVTATAFDTDNFESDYCNEIIVISQQIEEILCHQ